MLFSLISPSVTSGQPPLEAKKIKSFKDIFDVIPLIFTSLSLNKSINEIFPIQEIKENTNSKQRTKIRKQKQGKQKITMTSIQWIHVQWDKK